jgi:DNA-binding XRE family transcriptional regulator
MILKKLLLDTRRELNLTQKELADLLELDEMTIEFLEYGEPLWNTVPLQKKLRRIKHDRT